MSRMILASPVLSDAVGVTGISGSATQFIAPWSKTLTLQPGEVAQTQNLTNMFVQLDFGALNWPEWDMAAVLFHNGTNESLWRVQTSATPIGSGGTPVYDSGQCLRLLAAGGGQYVSQSALTNTSTGTIEGLVRVRASLPSASPCGIFRIAPTTDRIILYHTTAGNLAVYVDTATTDTSFVSSYVVRPYEWHHLAVVWSGGTIALYVDGVLIQSTALATYQSSGTVSVSAGQLQSPATNYLTGDVRELRYWTIARTPAQLEANRWSVTYPQTGLVGYWKLNGGTTNLGSAGSSATLVGTPGYVYAESMWASQELDLFPRRHALLYRKAAGRPYIGDANRYVRFDFSDPTNLDGALRIGRIYVALAFQPTYNFDYPGDEWAYADPSVFEAQPGGQTSVARYGMQPIRGPYVLHPTEAELYGPLHEIIRTRGASRDVLFVSDPDETPFRYHRMLYGHMVAPFRSIRTSYERRDLNLSFIGFE